MNGASLIDLSILKSHSDSLQGGFHYDVYNIFKVVNLFNFDFQGHFQYIQYLNKFYKHFLLEIPKEIDLIIC